MSPLGIAIITYNRRDALKHVVERVTALTRSPYRMVIAEDGGEDGSVEWANDAGLSVVSGTNRGACWNKNRGLYVLQRWGCDPLILLEDDTYPVLPGWERGWLDGTERWHHLAYAHPKIRAQVISGSGTPTDPFVNQKATAQCSSVSREAFSTVGYFDTRFRGYGVGHAEWTTRLKRAGYGTKRVTLDDGTVAKPNLYIVGGVSTDDWGSFRDNNTVAANRELFRRIKREPVYRDPWHDGGARDTFLREIAEAHLSAHA